MRSQQNFGKLAQRMEPKRHIDDLIVSAELRQQLEEIMVAAGDSSHIVSATHVELALKRELAKIGRLMV
ncbi:hypothetical protein HHL24_31380 [Paraburkholderia sp. RP-4-7]|uniref:Uncharacterized protein n=1 Tax=Paraburkholderia polaris TaxID=2728848 RepID=A0A848IJD8_9BURK|nr:hypothetical protein [Paraburkholderia polaris]NMM02412.1 hypothetical protein [Paraburkholderia polaris]